MFIEKTATSALDQSSFQAETTESVVNQDSSSNDTVVLEEIDVSIPLEATGIVGVACWGVSVISSVVVLFTL